MSDVAAQAPPAAAPAAADPATAQQSVSSTVLVVAAAHSTAHPERVARIQAWAGRLGDELAQLAQDLEAAAAPPEPAA